jgi:hypothetical protein
MHRISLASNSVYLDRLSLRTPLLAIPSTVGDNNSMKRLRTYIHFIAVILLILGCSKQQENFLQIDFLEYDWSIYDFEGKALKLVVIQYATIYSNRDCKCLTYHCSRNRYCSKEFYIDEKELSEFLKTSQEIQHDTLLNEGRNGRPLIKFVIHYKDHSQYVTVVRDCLDPDNSFVRFYGYLDSVMRYENNKHEISHELINKRNNFIKSICTKPFKDSLIHFPGMPDKNFTYMVDTTSI